MKKSDRNRIEGFEMWCWRKMLCIPWQEHCTNDTILTELGLERELMGRVAKLKLQYFGHITLGSRDVKRSSNIRTSVKIFGFEFVFCPFDIRF